MPVDPALANQPPSKCGLCRMFCELSTAERSDLLPVSRRFPVSECLIDLGGERECGGAKTCPIESPLLAPNLEARYT
jgi:hypothetical protein